MAGIYQEISPLQKHGLERPAFRLYLDNSAVSRALVNIFKSSGNRFFPVILENGIPFVEVGGIQRDALSVIKHHIIQPKTKQKTSEINPPDRRLYEYQEMLRMQEIAYADAIIEGRPFTPLSEEFQYRWKNWQRKHFMAYGEALIEKLAFTMLNGRRINH
jgi:hypothetical protein